MIGLLRRHWFLWSLAVLLLVGSAGHAALQPLTESVPRGPLVAAIMLAMSAPLNLQRSLSGRGPLLAAGVGIGVNTLLAGPLAWLAGFVLSDPLLAVGLVIAGLSPCTLASAAVWTRRGGGNEAVAIGVTVVTSLLSFVVLPTGAWLLLGQARAFDAGSLGLRLLIVVVVPIACGQLLRSLPSWRGWCDRHRFSLSTGAQTGLLLLVLIGAVRCGVLLEESSDGLQLTDGLMLLPLCTVVHLALFATGWRLARLVGARPAESLAAAIGGSQKTLAVGLTVALDFGPLAILPMIVYHASQLLVDTVLVDRIREKTIGNTG